MGARGDIAADFGKGFGKMVLSGDLVPNLETGSKKVLDEVFMRLQYEAPRLEAMMKVDAPWEDQTGNARNGLATRAYRSGTELGIVLFHQVPYGIWLELANDSRYAIIIPTIANESDRVIQAASGVMTKMRF